MWEKCFTSGFATLKRQKTCSALLLRDDKVIEPFFPESMTQWDIDSQDRQARLSLKKTKAAHKFNHVALFFSVMQMKNPFNFHCETFRNKAFAAGGTLYAQCNVSAT